MLVYRANPELLCLRATVGDAARDGVFAVLERDFRYPLNSRERAGRVVIPRTRTGDQPARSAQHLSKFAVA